MHHVSLPLTPAARARLTRQSYARMQERMQRVRRLLTAGSAQTAAARPAAVPRPERA